MSLLQELTSKYSKPGRVEWIGIRPERKADLLVLEEVEITLSGLAGDHRVKPGKRAVSLIQSEHLAVVASYIGWDAVDPAILRRNIAVSGINLLALKEKTICVGTAVLKVTGVCAPCSRMETLLGEGGYNAMRGHGGITAEVVTEGQIQLGSEVKSI